MEETISAVLIVASITSISSGTSQCGGLLPLSASFHLSLSSPRYPSHYQPYTHCIWLIEAGHNEAVHLVLHKVDAEEGANTCKDFVEIRAGGSNEDLLYSGCTGSDVSVESTYRWLWIRFRSDGRNESSGFTATAIAIASTTPENVTAPYKYTCPVSGYRCANMECVYRGYICDGYDDCGCDEDCDEDEDMCSKNSLDRKWRLLIGCLSGFFIFVVVIILVALGDRYTAKQKELQKQRGVVSKTKKTSKPKAPKTMKRSIVIHR